MSDQDKIAELLDENSVFDVIAMIADNLNDEAISIDIHESSQHYKDLVLAIDVLNAAAAGVDLNYGHSPNVAAAIKTRKKARRNFKAQADEITATL
jgi:hypothetical protein